MKIMKKHRIKVYITRSKDSFDNISENVDCEIEYNEVVNKSGKHEITPESYEYLMGKLSDMYSTEKENIVVYFTDKWFQMDCDPIEVFPGYVIITNENLYYKLFCEKRNERIDKILK